MLTRSGSLGGTARHIPQLARLVLAAVTAQPLTNRVVKQLPEVSEVSQLLHGAKADVCLCLCWSLQVSGIPAGVSGEEVEALLTGPGGIVVDRLDITTPEGPANRERMQVGALLEKPECLMPWG